MARARVYQKSTKADGAVVWGIDYTAPDGRRIRKAVGGRRAAEAALAKALVEAASSPSPEAHRRRQGDLTIGQLAERWSDHARRKGKVTWIEDAPKIRRLARYVGGVERRLASLTVDDIESMRTALEREGLTAGGRNRQLYVLRAALRWALGNGWLEWVPAIRSEPEPPSRERLWPDEALAAVCDRATPSLRTIIMLGRFCALRLSEARLMRWGRVYLDDPGGPYLVVGPEAKTKKSANRPVPIAPKLAAHLASIRPEAPDPEALVAPFDGRGAGEGERPWLKDSVSSGIKQHLRRAGFAELELSFHDLRHTRLTEIGKKTRNEIALADYAGHGSLATTRKYVHRRANDLRSSLGID